jgi:serine/threonine-protein kinase HipA
VLFSFLTGNADMHLKNFSLLRTPGLGYNLAPAYDLVATVLVNPADTEELALTLNGRKRKLKLSDFQAAMQRAGISDKVLTSSLRRFSKARPAWHRFITESFLPPELQQAYHRLLASRFARLGVEEISSG